MAKTNPHQIRAFHSKARFKFILAGRRGGKTYLVTEDIVRKLKELPKGGELWYIGPTNTQAKELIWEPLEQRLFDMKWSHSAFPSKSRFEFSGRRKVYVIGAEKISRIRGHAVYHAYLDELAFFEKPLAPMWRAIRPTLSDLKGGATMSTTPNGKGTQAYDVYLQAMEKPDWETFCWKTIDNPWIDPKEIEDAKRELDRESFLQEYEAQWQGFGDVAYYNFQEACHIKQQEIQFNHPIHLCFDFNVNPTSLLLSQHQEGRALYKREYSLANSSTEETVKVFCEEFQAHRGKMELFIRGDAAGKARSSNTGRSDYHYVEEVLTAHGFPFTRQVPSKNPPIVDRVKHVNSWLKPYVGDPRVEIDPSCKDLIRDLSSQGLDGRVPSKKNNLGHKADALGYDIFWAATYGKAQKQSTLIL